MNFLQIEDNLESTKIDHKHRWLKLSDEQLDEIAERRHQLVRKNQKASGDIKHGSQKHLSDWQRTQDDTNS